MNEQHHPTGNYHKIECTLSAARANLYALFFVLPILLIYIPAYLLVWPEQFSIANIKSTVASYNTLLMLTPVWLIVIFMLGAVVHELLHGLTWAIFCKRGVSSIKYGVHWAMLTPYCHCQEVLPLRPYLVGGMMPGIVMGLLPALLGLLMGQLLVFLFGLLFSMAAAGDLLVLWMLRHKKKEDLVQDHPEKIGCYVLVKE